MKMVPASTLLAILKDHTPISTGTIQTVREDFSVFYRSFQRDRHPSLTPVLISGRIPAWWVSVPQTRTDRTILFFHGGGFSVGSTADHLGLCTRLAETAAARVLSIDYRLAPEHPFPAAVDDGIAAYEYLIAQGIAPDRIVPVGISAGGTLVLTTLLTARDRSLPLPAAAVCMSPAVDMHFLGESVLSNQETDWVTPVRLNTIRVNYLKGHNPTDPRASPFYADLSGLPPLQIQAGSNEVLVDGIRTFVEKAKNSGIEVHFDLYEGMFHCWQIFADVLSEGAEAVERIGEFVRRQVPDTTAG